MSGLIDESWLCVSLETLHQSAKDTAALLQQRATTKSIHQIVSLLFVLRFIAKMVGVWELAACR
jgi:hypothetical protein